MVELDEAVMRVAREHMPSVAGGALDCYKGERSKVLKTTHQRTIQFTNFGANCCIFGYNTKLSSII